MAKWWRGWAEPARRRVRPLGVEVLEGRALLSAALPPAPKGVAAEVAPAAGHLIPALALQRPRHAKPWSPGGQTDLTFHGRLKFVTDTWKQAHSLAYSHDVIRTGWHYTRLALSRNTAKVGLAYVKAAVRGNGKEIHQLNGTRLVNQVGDQFTSLGRTNVVRHVGQAFSRFGHAVSNQFGKLFLSHANN